MRVTEMGNDVRLPTVTDGERNGEGRALPTEPVGEVGEVRSGVLERAEKPREVLDAARCRRVEDALYRRACGYKVKLKKSFKVKRVEYDPDTGKKLCEREELEVGLEEIHVPADVRVCAYYLNNRDPARWREHPKEGQDGTPDGVVDWPDMEEL